MGILTAREIFSVTLDEQSNTSLVFIAMLFSSAASPRVAAMCLTMWTYNTWALMLLDP